MDLTQRRLPHIHAAGQPLFVTFRLHGSLPSSRHFSSETLTSGHAFVHFDRLLERQSAGPLYLQMPDIARLVAASILAGAERDYILHAWVVMPNHVHLLVTPLTNVSALMRRLKGSTARRAHLRLCLAGRPFWQHESYDRLVRDSVEFRQIENYIVQNPVRAGLAVSAELYRWSSAWAGEAG